MFSLKLSELDETINYYSEFIKAIDSQMQRINTIRDTLFGDWEGPNADTSRAQIDQLTSGEGEGTASLSEVKKRAENIYKALEIGREVFYSQMEVCDRMYSIVQGDEEYCEGRVYSLNSPAGKLLSMEDGAMQSIYSLSTSLLQNDLEIGGNVSGSQKKGWREIEECWSSSGFTYCSYDLFSRSERLKDEMGKAFDAVTSFYRAAVQHREQICQVEETLVKMLGEETNEFAKILDREMYKPYSSGIPSEARLFYLSQKSPDQYTLQEMEELHKILQWYYTANIVPGGGGIPGAGLQMGIMFFRSGLDETNKYLRLSQNYQIALKSMRGIFGQPMVEKLLEELKNRIAEMEKSGDDFKMHLEKQFGFDERTCEILWSVYKKIQSNYPDECDWYFARALSQLGDYNSYSKKVLWMDIETDAWRNGAGWAYEYDEEEKFYCEGLGLSTEDYKYLRHMVRLQHFMSSNYENKYSYQTVCDMQKKDPDQFKIWLTNMEKATGRKFNDDEYLEYYKDLYKNMGDKGDFSHMLYTISANLNDGKHKVDNKWYNIGAPSLSWKDSAERKDISGWLGDAVYTGDNNKVSFGNDDFIADLDADNIAHRINTKNNISDAINDYYSGLASNADEKRIKEFLGNNSYEYIETAILKKIALKDVDSDGKRTLKDLEGNEAYSDTYDFLTRLKENQK